MDRRLVWDIHINEMCYLAANIKINTQNWTEFRWIAGTMPWLCHMEMNKCFVYDFAFLHFSFPCYRAICVLREKVIMSASSSSSTPSNIKYSRAVITYFIVFGWWTTKSRLHNVRNGPSRTQAGSQYHNNNRFGNKKKNTRHLPFRLRAQMHTHNAAHCYSSTYSVSHLHSRQKSQ